MTAHLQTGLDAVYVRIRRPTVYGQRVANLETKVCVYAQKEINLYYWIRRPDSVRISSLMSTDWRQRVIYAASLFSLLCWGVDVGSELTNGRDSASAQTITMLSWAVKVLQLFGVERWRCFEGRDGL